MIRQRCSRSDVQAPYTLTRLRQAGRRPPFRGKPAGAGDDGEVGRHPARAHRQHRPEHATQHASQRGTRHARHAGVPIAVELAGQPNLAHQGLVHRLRQPVVESTSVPVREVRTTSRRSQQDPGGWWLEDWQQTPGDQDWAAGKWQASGMIAALWGGEGWESRLACWLACSLLN